MDAGAVDDGYGATRRGNVDGEGNLNGGWKGVGWVTEECGTD